MIPRQIPGFGSFNSIVLARSGALHYTSDRQQDDVYLLELDRSSGMLTGSPRLIADSRPGTVDLPTFSPDGRRVALLGTRRGPPAILVASTPDFGIERSIAVPGLRSGYQMLWAADARSLLILGDDLSNRWGVHQVELDGKVTLVAPDRGPPVVKTIGFAPAPAGNALLVLQAEDDTLTLKTFDPKAQAPTEIFSEKLGKDGWGSLSPTGRRMILYSSAARESFDSFNVVDLPEMRRYRVSTSRPVKIGSDVAWAPDDRSVLFFGPPDPANPAARSLWRLSLEDGAARPLGVVNLPGLQNPMAVHPDGTRIAVNAKTTIAEYWTTESVLPAPDGAR